MAYNPSERNAIWSSDDSSCSEDDRFIQDTNSEDILHDGLISPDRVISPELSLRASSSGVRQDHQPPVYIPEDVPVPEYFELRESKSFQGLGVWAKVLIPEGELFGPFTGVLKTKLNDASCAWKIVDGTNNIKAWIDASEPGTGNWMKYICRTKTKESQNLMAVQVQDQVYYRTIRDVHPAEEMLLYSTESPYPDPKELDNLTFGKINQDDNMYTCSECDEVFSSQVALKRHQAYTCPKLVRLMTNDHYRSEDDSKSATDPDTHLHDESADGEFKCEECPRSFQWKSNLVRHQISHDSGRRYQCENCDKVFTDPSNLQRHIRSQHVGARCHACAECGKTFATSSGLKQHQHIHSSVKPFQCEVCLKAYTQFSNLCRHKRMHADCRQQIKCKDCGQAFSTVTSLSKHKRFCEGALRNGMHMGFSTDKMNPMNLPAAGNPANTLNPALLMGMYRPPFPFYPPVGATYPVFPSGPIPFASMHSPMSPSNPSKLGQAMSPDAKAMIPRLSPRPLSAGSDSKHEERHRRNSMGSEPSDSPFSSSSEAEHDFSGVSDAESESSGLKKPKPIFPSERTRNLLSSSHLTSEPVPLPVYSPSPIRRSPIDSKSHKDQDIPFDLSKSNKSSATPSPDIVTPNKEKSVSGGEQPLDLTQKVPKEVTPPENARKTHIFGELRSPQVTPESKLHYAYPQFPNHLLFDHSLRMDKEKLSQSMQEASRFLPFAARFPMTNASFAASMNPFGMMKHEAMEKNLSPMLKMDKFPDQFSAYSSPGNKLKERYSCKFCGKVFPRSANLTRHLRTHTGEQPYKCKYCERSFSISSNLQRHVRNIHNKEKPFKCPLCDRCFGQQTNLDRHLKKHDSEDPSIMDSPLNEPDLDEKDESYFSEIRNFIGKATESGLSRGIMNGLEDRHPLMDHEVERDDKYDVAVEAESDIDDDELLEDEEESALEQPPVKKICLTPPRFYTNNNDEEKTFVATHFQNGYRELEKEEEEVDVISDSEVKSATSTIV